MRQAGPGWTLVGDTCTLAGSGRSSNHGRLGTGCQTYTLAAAEGGRILALEGQGGVAVGGGSGGSSSLKDTNLYISNCTNLSFVSRTPD